MVTKTVSRRGRSRGAAAPFGFFAGRGGRTGNATRSRSAYSAENVVSTNNSLARPKSGPGSRGGAGAYNKSKKIKRNETENDDNKINTNPPRALSPISLHSDSSENSPVRKTTIRIKKNTMSSLMMNQKIMYNVFKKNFFIITYLFFLFNNVIFIK